MNEIMTDAQWFILRHLWDREQEHGSMTWTKPTQIGRAFGKGYDKSSAWASPKCKKLVELGLLQRHENGWYRLSIRGENKVMEGIRERRWI